MTKPANLPAISLNNLQLARQTPAGFALYTTDNKWMLARHLAFLNRRLVDLAAGRIRRLLINMPPRSGKSELVSRIFPAWYLGNFPDNKIIFASYEASFAAEHGAAARDLVEEYGNEVFGVTIKSKMSSMARWGIEGHRGGMMSVGAGGPLTGKGANILILDDLIKDSEQAESVTQLEKLWAWFGCFHPDTDYLTNKGWIPVSKVTLESNLATVNPQTM